MLLFDLSHVDMKQEPQKETPANLAQPEKPAVPEEPPVPTLRPEDEAVVAERLRDLGYIE